MAASLALVALSASAARGQDCSVRGQNAFVAAVLQEYYLWYRELPSTDPSLFDSPEAYLDAVRYRPLDQYFSYITTQQQSDAYYSASEYAGVGFSAQQTSAIEYRITQVYPESPASDAEMMRGDFITAVNGRPIAELLVSGELGQELGPNTVGHGVEIEWRRPNGRELRASFVKRVVTIPTVSQAEVIDVDGRPVGYVHLRNFVEPSFEALDRAFAKFREASVLDVVLDLRYNGGGLISVATHLGSLIGGLRTNTQVFVELVHNDKNTFRNSAQRFHDPEGTLDLPRLVVITTRSSASSSELVINGLAPFIPVTLVGAPTYGKPVGQYGFDFCDKVIFPVAFKNVNARGEGDYFDGLPVDCPSSDDLSRPLANPDEDSLEQALHFLRTGRCPMPPAAETPGAAPGRAPGTGVEALPLFPPLQTGFQALVNAW